MGCLLRPFLKTTTANRTPSLKRKRIGMEARPKRGLYV